MPSTRTTPDTLPSSHANRSSPLRELMAGGLATLIMAAIVCTRAAVDPDLWGHLRFGLDLLDGRWLSTVDPYSFTQDVPWINHEWLSELLFAAAYRAAGVIGIVLLKGIVVAAAFMVLARTTRQAAELYRWRILAAAILSAGPAAVALRPQIWTVLGLAIVCHLLLERTRLYLLPVVFAIWANLHGGWIVGAGVAGLYLAGRLLDTRSIRAVVPYAAALAIGIAASAVNPYGWHLWTFLASTVGPSREVEEWRPLWEQTRALGFLFLWFVIAVGIVGASVARRRSKLTFGAMLPTVALGVMSLFVTRLLPLFSIVAAFMLAPAWADGDARPQPSRATRPGVKLARVAVIALVCVLQLSGPARCLPIDAWWTPDLVAAGAFEHSQAGGRLVVPFNWGEFAIWHWGPRLRVGIDGRRETVYSAHTLDVQNLIAFGQPAGIAFLDRERPEYVWLRNDTAAATKQWLASHGYRIDVDTGVSFIATRAELPPLAPAATLRGCFP